MVQCPYRDLWKAPRRLSPPYLTSLICFWNASSHLWLSCDNILYQPVIEFCRQVSHWFLPCWPFMHGRSSLKRTAIPSQFPEISPELVPLCPWLTLTTLRPCACWNYFSSCYETYNFLYTVFCFFFFFPLRYSSRIVKSWELSVPLSSLC